MSTLTKAILVIAAFVGIILAVAIGGSLGEVLKQPLAMALATSTPTALPTATATTVPTATMVPTATSTAIPTATMVPTSTPRPPTATAVPSNTPVPPTRVVVPTRAPRVIPSPTSVYETSYLESLHKQTVEIQKELPQSVAVGVRWDWMTDGPGRRLDYFYTLTTIHLADIPDLEAGKVKVMKEGSDLLCPNAAIRAMLRENVVVNFEYVDMDDVFIMEGVFTEAVCVKWELSKSGSST